MDREFTEEDVGKTVIVREDEIVGTIHHVEDGVAFVVPAPGKGESIRQRLGWGDDTEDTYPLSPSRVGAMTNSEVKIQSPSPGDESTTTTSAAADNGGWKQRLLAKSDILQFLNTTLSLLKQANDPDKFAQAMADGDVDRALEHTEMTEEELAQHAEAIERDGKKALEDPEVRDGALQYKEGNNDRSS